MAKEYSEMDETDAIITAMNELVNFSKDNYSVSVAYEDLTYGYSFYYNENKVYYAASTINSLVALYVYTKAAEGSINLDDTITYTSKYVYSYSEGVKKHKLGFKIPIRTLVKYSIIYSDNSAYQMLISYIGKSKIKEFGKSLGVLNTLNDGDNFGNISANDGLIYMKSIDDFVNNNGELGLELKSFFIESNQKELAVDNLAVANKYGLYKNYYHNMGIVYDDSPYVVSIMTLEGYNDRENIINTISNKIYNLHT